MRLRIPHLVLLLLAALVQTGCASTAPHGGDQPGDAETALRSEVRTWVGTPHRMGGTTRRGADCSGFVQAVMRDALGVDVPRTTELQLDAGRSVRRKSLEAGDLVFFQNPNKSYHVGIYLSDGEFAHASSSRGVMLSTLDERYWRQHYIGARRVADARPAGPPRVLPGAAERASRRGGW